MSAGADAVRRPPSPLAATLGCVGAAAALGAVFLLYLRPDFVLTLAGQLWACF